MHALKGAWLVAKQPEGKLSTKIMTAWRLRGGWCYKVHGSEYQPAGIPDISGVFEGYSVWCESKMPGNKPSMIQWKRIRDIRRRGGLVVIAYSVAEAVQMLEHISTSDCTHDYNECLYSEHVDLAVKLATGDYK